MKIDQSIQKTLEILRKRKHRLRSRCCLSWVYLQNCEPTKAVTVSTTTRVCVPPPPPHRPLTSHSGSSKHPLRKQQAELIWLTWRRSLPFSSLTACQCSLPKCSTIFSSIDTSLSSACSPPHCSFKLIKVHSDRGIKKYEEYFTAALESGFSLKLPLTWQFFSHYVSHRCSTSACSNKLFKDWVTS